MRGARRGDPSDKLVKCRVLAGGDLLRNKAISLTHENSFPALTDFDQEVSRSTLRSSKKFTCRSLKAAKILRLVEHF